MTTHAAKWLNLLPHTVGQLYCDWSSPESSVRCWQASVL